jgi:hypothetical protein
MNWQLYQHHIADLFRQLHGAFVEEDIHADGNSGASRQIDVRVRLPLAISLGMGSNIQVDLTITLIVDAKEHEGPVDLGYVEQCGGRESLDSRQG